ncbi:hypothetical protein MJO28_002556 [Puccinia striiformis f. sp. tritici]|uniref:Uncharacterized protein n=1 Tax=Puccinia striiformis f. sp. tritici TaxID=168172 RepID=A0ACC0EQ91_9BASI|nr:hypothetical protein MJO28_002556 [Puccinia striiformis f. sp. tritici]
MNPHFDSFPSPTRGFGQKPNPRCVNYGRGGVMFIGAGRVVPVVFWSPVSGENQHTKASIADYVLRTHSVLLPSAPIFRPLRYTYKAARKAKTEKAAPDDLSSWRSARLWRSVGTQRGNDSSKSQWQVLETVEPTRDAGNDS